MKRSSAKKKRVHHLHQASNSPEAGSARASTRGRPSPPDSLGSQWLPHLLTSAGAGAAAAAAVVGAAAVEAPPAAAAVLPLRQAPPLRRRPARPPLRIRFGMSRGCCARCADRERWRERAKTDAKCCVSQPSFSPHPSPFLGHPPARPPHHPGRPPGGLARRGRHPGDRGKGTQAGRPLPPRPLFRAGQGGARAAESAASGHERGGRCSCLCCCCCRRRCG